MSSVVSIILNAEVIELFYSMDTEICAICGNILSSAPVVTVKSGLETLYEYRKSQNDGKFLRNQTKNPIVLHVHCRKNYTRRLRKEEGNNETKRFDFNRYIHAMCLFCSERCVIDPKNLTQSHDIRFVQTIEFEGTILDQCNLRNDDLAKEVAIRAQGVIDLVSVECRYHVYCFSKLMKLESTHKVGRPAISDSSLLLAFDRLCNHLESSETDCDHSVDGVA